MLNELLTPKTAQSIEDELRARLIAQGLEPGGEGATLATILKIDAEAEADRTQLIPKIAAGGYLDLAEGAWLDELARSQFAETRKGATQSRLYVVLSDPEGLGPYPLQAQTLWAVSRGGKRFYNETSGELPRNGEVALVFRSEGFGTSYNLPSGSVERLATPLPGVAVAQGSFLEPAADAETDASLRERCRLKWAALGEGGTAGRYEYFARTADPAITKVTVLDDHPRGQGTVDVVLSGPGVLSEEVIERARTAIVPRTPLLADVVVEAATAREVPFSARVFVAATQRSSAVAQHENELAQLEATQGIGATLYRTKLVDVLMNPSGVRNVELDFEDTALTRREVAALAPTLIYEEI